ncbi:hypothetical protein ACE38V_14025 [Cytobacillus sp. Hz8]|uniref:hypothetical protein n=1 Tax=Cytobacillus sp. Hz8 TaxID=3347168 RepID=UPI0035DC6A89
MQYIIFASSLLFIIYIYAVTKDLLIDTQAAIKKQLYWIFQFLKFAPVLALGILTILVFTYLHTEPGIRFSHAWNVSLFWTYATFLFFIFRLTKKKLSLFFAGISFLIAIYNTPLFRYEHLFHGSSVLISDIIGVFMFLFMWAATSKIMTRKLI